MEGWGQGLPLQDVPLQPAACSFFSRHCMYATARVTAGCVLDLSHWLSASHVFGCTPQPPQDIVTRYACATGHHCTRRFGWDCHGLPVEYEIDKKLGEARLGAGEGVVVMVVCFCVCGPGGGGQGCQ